MKKKILSMLLVLIVIGISSIGVFAESSEGKVDENYSYEYPITPESDVWKELDTPTLKKMLNIPQNDLNGMSTKELFQVVKKYPYFGDICLYNSVEDGILSVSGQFTGMRELLAREDLASVLIEEYIQMNLNEKTRESVGYFELSFVKSVLSFEEIYTKLDKNEQLYVDEKLNSSESELSLMATNSVVFTPRGSRVSTIQFGEELSAAQKKESDNYVRGSYPKAVKLRDATTNYNCHSYAWYSTYAGNRDWMNDPSTYMKDGSYRYIGGNATAKGQKVYWGNGVHSGICSETSSNYTSMKITSKWGQAGLYSHTFIDSPYSVGWVAKVYGF